MTDSELLNLKEGLYTILNWTVMPNKNENSKPFTKNCMVETERSVYEIIEISGAKNNKDLCSKLTIKGVEITNHLDNFFVCMEGEIKKDYIEVFLVNKKDYADNNCIITLTENVYSINRYTLNRSDVINCGGKWFYSKVSIDMKINKKLKLREDEYIVRSEFKNWFSWSKGKQEVGLFKTEWQKLANYISQNNFDNNLLSKLSNELGCSIEESKNKLIDFLQRKGEKLDDSDSLISNYNLIVENHLETRNKWIDIVSDKYKSEINNQVEMENAKRQELTEELKNLETEIKNRQKAIEGYKQVIENQESKLCNIEQAIMQNKSEFERNAIELEHQIAQRKNEMKLFETEFEHAVAEKVKRTKENLADSLADMAFYSLVTNNNAQKKQIENFKEYDIIETNNSLADINAICSILFDNLNKIKVRKDYSLQLGMWLFAAYHTRTPILLAGPNAQLIADAISVSLFSRKASVFYCEGEPTHDAIEQIYAASSEIIVLKHALQSKWVDYFPEFLSIKNKYFFVTHPYIEDLQIEPRSLYSYVLPLFTELFVVPLCDDQFFHKLDAGIMSNEILNIMLDCRIRRRMYREYKDKLIEIQMYGGYLIDKIFQLCTTYDLVKQNKIKFDCEQDVSDDDALLLLCYLPYAYVTGQINKLKDRLDASEIINLSKDCEDILHYYVGD